jgi:hypothetical protein
MRATKSFVEFGQTRPTYFCWNLFGDIRSAIVLFEDKTDCFILAFVVCMILNRSLLVFETGEGIIE